MSETESRDVGRADSGAIEAFGERARADAGVDEQDAGHERRIAAFPAEPLARMQSSRDIGLFVLFVETASSGQFRGDGAVVGGLGDACLNGECIARKRFDQRLLASKRSPSLGVRCAPLGRLHFHPSGFVA